MSGQGWVVLDRSLLDHWLWSDRPFSKGQAWIDLLLMAKHRDQKFVNGGKIIEGKRGVVYRSVKSLADRWGWDRKKVTRFLRLLEKDGMATSESTPNGTAITIVNYGKFQDYGTTGGTTNGTTTPQQMGQQLPTQWDNSSPSSPHLLPTYNNVNNENNIVFGNNYSLLAEAEAPHPTSAEIEKIISTWNQIPHTVKLSGITPMTSRYDKLRGALDIVGMPGVMQAIQRVKDSAWMSKSGHISFDRWINRDCIQKLLEGEYQDLYDKKEVYTGELGFDWETSDEDHY